MTIIKREQVTIRILPETNRTLTIMAEATAAPKGLIIEQLVEKYFKNAKK